MAEYSLTPKMVPHVETEFRRIATPLPVPESLPILEELRRSEPRSMSGQPPVVWSSADDFTVSDMWGNRWIDWSSGVLISNAGHANPRIIEALRAKLDQRLISTYVFPHEDRSRLVKALRELSPDPDNYKVFLLSTGSEATENCLKLAKSWGLKQSGAERHYIVSFENAFHGRTMGAQLAGGMEKQKQWLVPRDPSFIQVPFPDGFKNSNVSFTLFEETLDRFAISPAQIAAVISESYQGIGPDFFPDAYAKSLETFCRKNGILLIMDEVQAGFCRTGKMFCYEHYGIKPDLIACGKGISSSLPLSAVIGRADVMEFYAPGSMTSTHSASPLAVAAALANVDYLISDKVAERAAHLGDDILIPELRSICAPHKDVLGCVHGRGLVAGVQAVRKGTREPDPELALAVNIACFHKGLLMFAPVGIAGECVKIAPPLTISEAALRESLQIFKEAVTEVLEGPAC